MLKGYLQAGPAIIEIEIGKLPEIDFDHDHDFDFDFDHDSEHPNYENKNALVMGQAGLTSRTTLYYSFIW